MNESTPDTVLVLGAGASADYGFPLGRGLFKELSERMLADRYSGFHDILREVCEEKDITHSASALKDSNDDTIDEFLAESGDAVCRTVKIAMSYMLLNQERVLDQAALIEQNDRWYKELWTRTLSQCNTCKAVSIVTFNYDRSLDAYICRAESGRQQKKGRGVVLPERIIEIIHVHGALGTTDPREEWWRRGTGAIPISEALKASQGVRVYSEDRDDAITRRIRHICTYAKQVVFMGFGFHRQNIEVLGPLKQETEIYSSDKEKDTQVQAMAAERLGRNPVWGPDGSGCLGLLRNNLAGWFPCRAN